MKKSINGLTSSAISFAFHKIFSNFLLILQTAGTIGFTWIMVFTGPLVAICTFFYYQYGINMAECARIYLNYCIPAQNCTWSDFVSLILKVYENAQMGPVAELSIALIAWGIFFALLQGIFFVWMQFGIIKICLAVYDAKKITMRAFLTDAGLTIRGCSAFVISSIGGYFAFIISTFFMSAFSYVGILAVLIFFVWVVVRFTLVFWFMRDRDMGVYDSFRKSFYVTDGHGFEILGLIIVCGLVGLLGQLITTMSLIGGWIFSLLITVPFFYLSMAYVYRRLAKK